jgi:hypothetical protein
MRSRQGFIQVSDGVRGTLLQEYEIFGRSWRCGAFYRDTILARLGFIFAFLFWSSRSPGQDAETNSPAATNRVSRFNSENDAWLGVSGLLDQKFGFIPVAIPEPAVGYGVVGGLAFRSSINSRSATICSPLAALFRPGTVSELPDSGSD